MTSTEWRTTLGLSAVYALRMFGLFMVLPAFAPFAARMEGGELALLVGLALGVYGLTQAVCQIPFGMASDRFGRKPVIVAGMLIFAAGSWLAGSSETIAGLIAGRALQGAGAHPPPPEAGLRPALGLTLPLKPHTRENPKYYLARRLASRPIRSQF